ncbi:MAG TPA: hypothetical protein VIL84_14985 [Devosiaceae bacterium]
MINLSFARKTARAAIAAAVLGTSAIAAMPAQAYDGPSFSFSFGSGGSSFSIYSDGYNDYRWDRHDRWNRCLTDRQIFREVRRDGYRNVSIIRELPRFVTVRAVKHGWVYRLTVNRCNGNIARVARLHRAWR